MRTLRPRPARPTRRTSRPASLLALSAVLLALAAATATPCAACSCAEPGTVAESAARADVVFVGTFVRTREPPVRLPAWSSGDAPVARVFEVSEVRKGRADAVTEIRTSSSGGSCGLEVELGRTYVVVARATQDGLRSDLCDGTRLLSLTTPGDLEAVGPATPPEVGSLAVDLPVVDPATLDAVRAPVVWGTGAALLVGVVGLLVLVGKRRRGGG